MTNEEAIFILKRDNPNNITVRLGFESLYDQREEAFLMAIKALEQEDVLDKIKTEIKEWYWQADKQALSKDPCVVDAMIDLFIRTIDKYKAESENKE